jgi:hypothetical protein
VPRYFFNVRRGALVIPDHEGDELQSVEAARELALEIVHDMRRLPHIYGEMREWQRDEFVITDESGRTALHLPFAATADEG